MKKELQELYEIEEKVAGKLTEIKNGTCDLTKDMNFIKVLKNDIYQKASKAFIFNLKKLIQIESTQKNLAQKIGISEDLLSKYKSREAFPAIETLIYICKIYDLELSKLIYTPLTTEDIVKSERTFSSVSDIFENEYYVYFFVTNFKNEGKIHEGRVQITENKAVFRIMSEETVIKEYMGTFNISDKLIFFNLNSTNDGNAYINMIRPNLNKSRYIGGTALMMLSSDANSKPCSQKLIFSKVKIDRQEYYETLKELLNFKLNGTSFCSIKISPADDESTYQFIQSML